MKNGGGQFTPKLGGHFELELGGHFKLKLGGQYHWNLQYKREIRNWKLNGFSEFFNKNGKLTQKVVFKRGIPIKIHILENGIMKELNYEFDKKTRTIVITVPNNS
ncbi:MAG: hypothetical protein ACYCZ2_15030 [Lutibacter sp.]